MNTLRKEIMIVSSMLLCSFIPKVLANPNHLERHLGSQETTSGGDGGQRPAIGAASPENSVRPWARKRLMGEMPMAPHHPVLEGQ
jgi:hypothetical protein